MRTHGEQAAGLGRGRRGMALWSLGTVIGIALLALPATAGAWSTGLYNEGAGEWHIGNGNSGYYGLPIGCKTELCEEPPFEEYYPEFHHYYTALHYAELIPSGRALAPTGLKIEGPSPWIMSPLKWGARAESEGIGTITVQVLRAPSDPPAEANLTDEGQRFKVTFHKENEIECSTSMTLNLSTAFSLGEPLEQGKYLYDQGYNVEPPFAANTTSTTAYGWVAAHNFSVEAVKEGACAWHGSLAAYRESFEPFVVSTLNSSLELPRSTGTDMRMLWSAPVSEL